MVPSLPPPRKKWDFFLILKSVAEEVRLRGEKEEIETTTCRKEVNGEKEIIYFI